MKKSSHLLRSGCGLLPQKRSNGFVRVRWQVFLKFDQFTATCARLVAVILMAARTRKNAIRPAIQSTRLGRVTFQRELFAFAISRICHFWYMAKTHHLLQNHSSADWFQEQIAKAFGYHVKYVYVYLILLVAIGNICSSQHTQCLFVNS